LATCRHTGVLSPATREREQLTDRIESLQQMLADEKSERRQLTALLSDQREKGTEPQRRGFWARLRG
jgi:putative ubiquitin-RnfH superfamily antitoxin RatB of RatAB toxin-antitoxin module